MNVKDLIIELLGIGGCSCDKIVIDSNEDLSDKNKELYIKDVQHSGKWCVIMIGQK